MNSDSSLDASAFLNSYSKYSTDDMDTTTEEEKKQPDPLNTAINEIMSYKAKHRISLKGTSDLSMLLNNRTNCLAHVHLPTSPLTLKKNTNIRFIREFILICKCGKLCNEKNWCTICKAETKKKKSNFVVKIQLGQQIKHLLLKYPDQIMKHINRKQNEDISDIDDGLLYKKLTDDNPDSIIFSFTINSDGAPIYNSNKTSMWPVQLYANFLPPELRFKRENILIHMLYASEKKPDFMEIFAILAQEIEFLQENKIRFLYNSIIYNCMVVVMLASFDLPARAMASGQKLYSGEKACVFCLHPGIKVKDHTNNIYTRYTKIHPEPCQRSHAGAISAIAKFNAKSSSNDPYGLISIPPMILFPKFDLSNGYTIDYMHNSALNIMKLLIDFWMGKHRLCKNSKYFKPLAPKHRILLNKRLVAIKPCSYVTRKPRTLDDRAFFKATEYRYLLLYYLRFALQGLLDHNQIKHFELFSASIYILLKSKITKTEVEEVRVMLNRFADDFEKLYGIESITMNIHIVRHYADSVINCGPLWAYSMFGFEKNIGNLKKNVMNATDALETISFHYCMNESTEVSDGNEMRMPAKSMLKDSEVTLSEKTILIESLSNNEFRFGHSCKISSHIYTSTKSPITKSIDFFLQMNNTEIGSAQLYIENNGNTYVLIDLYEVTEKHYHLCRIKSTGQRKLFMGKDIFCKLIYMKLGCFEIVAKEPNFFETT